MDIDDVIRRLHFARMMLHKSLGNDDNRPILDDMRYIHNGTFTKEDAADVEECISRIMGLLFTPPYGDGLCTPPVDFWDTELGKAISSAQYQIYASEYMTITEFAAKIDGKDPGAVPAKAKVVEASRIAGTKIPCYWHPHIRNRSHAKRVRASHVDLYLRGEYVEGT